MGNTDSKNSNINTVEALLCGRDITHVHRGYRDVFVLNDVRIEVPCSSIVIGPPDQADQTDQADQRRIDCIEKRKQAADSYKKITGKPIASQLMARLKDYPVASEYCELLSSFKSENIAVTESLVIACSGAPETIEKFLSSRSTITLVLCVSVGDDGVTLCWKIKKDAVVS